MLPCDPVVASAPPQGRGLPTATPSPVVVAIGFTFASVGFSNPAKTSSGSLSGSVPERCLVGYSGPTASPPPFCCCDKPVPFALYGLGEPKNLNDLVGRSALSGTSVISRRARALASLTPQAVVRRLGPFIAGFNVLPASGATTCCLSLIRRHAIRSQSKQRLPKQSPLFLNVDNTFKFAWSNRDTAGAVTAAQADDGRPHSLVLPTTRQPAHDKQFSPAR